ncbi:RpiR family transcriptional regulator [Stackebrandtia albiflava]|uniref:RpiR family transcriptional regulator n=1 Tax=Stackebrandtia albiflava TaxID=406432 RepID=A0A562VAH5_9ACTN|nr:MurR/RpiR family transcriptional regulator [Stackebrandtia albiflava]TWJ14889.1 RpiR family transcriptional regulator [Stackebrandtia albiflava]
MSTPSPQPANLLTVVNGVLPSLTAAEARVAQVVLRDPGAVAELTITALAEAADTSEATVIRFCRSLGLDGHRQLRLRAAQTAAREETGTDRRVAGGDIPVGADMRRIIETVAYADSHAVQDTVHSLDADVCAQVVELLSRAGRVDVYGAGASGFVAADLAQKLHRIGHTVFSWADVHAGLTGAALLGTDDVAVGISHTGKTSDTVDFLSCAQRRGAHTVALTNHPRSPIAAVADHVLVTAARETTFRSGATASRIAQLTVIDCLFVGVAARDGQKATEALATTAAAVAGRRRT